MFRPNKKLLKSMNSYAKRLNSGYIEATDERISYGFFWDRRANTYNNRKILNGLPTISSIKENVILNTEYKKVENGGQLCKGFFYNENVS